MLDEPSFFHNSSAVRESVGSHKMLNTKYLEVGGGH